MVKYIHCTQSFASYLVKTMECATQTLNDVTAYLDILVPYVLMVRTEIFRTVEYTHVLSDVIECGTDNEGCDQICTDFLGGYSCSCRSGFRTDGNSCTGMFVGMIR